MEEQQVVHERMIVPPVGRWSRSFRFKDQAQALECPWLLLAGRFISFEHAPRIGGRQRRLWVDFGPWTSRARECERMGGGGGGGDW